MCVCSKKMATQKLESQALLWRTKVTATLLPGNFRTVSKSNVFCLSHSLGDNLLQQPALEKPL